MCKETKEEYKVLKSFNLLDLWDAFEENHSCVEFQGVWGNLLNQFNKKNWRVSDRFIFFSKECVPSILWYHRDKLEEKGFIKKIKKDIILKPGMKLGVRNCFYIYEVVCVPDGDYMIFAKDRFLNRIDSKGDRVQIKFDNMTTLQSINHRYNHNLEVVDEP